MTPFAWQECIHRVRAIWGRQGSTKWDNAEKVYRSNATIQRLDQQQVMATIGTYETEGKEWAPSIPQVLARATGNTGTIDRPEPAMCPHPDDRVSQLGNVEVCSLCLTEWQHRDLAPDARVAKCGECGDTRYVYSDGQMYPCRRCEDEAVGIVTMESTE